MSGPVEGGGEGQGRSRLRAVVAVVLLIGALGALAFHRFGRPPEEASAPPVEAAPVPAPADLLADVVVTSPGTTWTKLQRSLGGTLGLLPPSFAGALVLGLGLDAQLSAEIDPTTPGFAALSGDPLAPAWAVALRLSDPRHARAVLAQGDTARYEAREASGLTELAPRRVREAGVGAGEAPPVVLGLAPGGFVLLASSPAALVSLGPYTTRTLARRALPASSTLVVDVPRAALEGVLVPRAKQAWEARRTALLLSDERARLAHGGRAPDFGDPRAIVAAVDRALGARIGTLADMDHARLVVDLLEEDARFVLTLTPREGAGPASAWVRGLAAVPWGPLLGALPKSAALAGVVARPVADPDGGAAEGMAKAFSEMLGERLSPGDEQKVRSVLEGLAKTGGAPVAFAVPWDPPGVLVRAEVVDREAASRALRGAVELAAAPPLDGLLRVKGTRTSEVEAEGVGKATLATFVRAPEPKAARPHRPRPHAGGGPEPEAFGLAWVAEKRDLLVAVGPDPLTGLRALSRPEVSLGREPAVTRALTALGAPAEVDVALALQPFLTDERRAPLPAAPLVVTLGREERAAIVRTTVAYGLLREASRLSLGP